MRTLIYSVVAAATMALAGVSSAFAQGHIIIVNANAPGVGFNDTTPVAPVGGNPGTTKGEQRLNVFAFAANIWEQVLQPRTDIFVVAQFAPLGTNVLGSAGATFVFRNFPGAEYPDTWYTSAEADHLAGVDQNPGFADIQAQFSSDFDFYFGFDNNEGVKVDLLPVVLHELGHGLGFANFANEATGTLLQNGKDIYSQYTLDVTTNKLWNDMTNEERQASAINVRKVSWSGINVKKDVPGVLSPGEPFARINGATPQLLSFGTAAFGNPLTPAGVTGDVVVGLDAAIPLTSPTTTDGCSPFTNAADVAGKIALVDRGTCGFVVKVKNAQDAGAIAVIVADNVLADPPAGLGGADPTITIPSGRITLPAGNAIRTALTTGPVNVTLGLDMSILAGTDRVKGLMMVAALNPVALGSSISHWDTAATRNQLMEPAINVDLTSSVTPPEDLTSSQMTDIGWFSDRDGVPDGVDSCIGSDTKTTVVIKGCNTKAGNDVQANGCTVADDINQCQIDFAGKPLHQLACAITKAERLRKAGIITTKEAAGILTCSILTLGR
jgi:PA domain-containing protein